MKAWMNKDSTLGSKRNLFGMMTGKSKGSDLKDDTFKSVAGKFAPSSLFTLF
jgi:hypothetical protein